MPAHEPTVDKRVPPPGRRHDDCSHLEAHFDQHHAMGWRTKVQAVAHYLMISAAISVLIMTYQMSKTLNHLETATNALLNSVNIQTAELQKIHESIHAEATISRSQYVAHHEEEEFRGRAKKR